MSRQTAKNVFFVSAAKIFSLASILVASALVARATEPASFGYFSVAISIILLLEALTGAPLDNAVVRFSNLHPGFYTRIERALGYIFKLKIAIGVIIFILVWLFLSPLSEKLLDENAPDSILLVSIFSLISILIVRSSASFMQINGRFDSYAHIDTAQGLLRLVLTVSLYLTGCTSVVLYLAAYGMSSALTFFITLFLQEQKYICARQPSASDRKIVFSYIGVTSAIVMLGAISGRADVPILSALGSSQQAAYYSVASQLAAMGTLLASYVAIVFQPKVIQMAKDNTLNSAINKNVVLGLVLALIGIPIAYYLSPLIIPLIFGEVYIASAAIFNILIIGICADLITLPILLSYAIQVIPGQILIGEAIVTVCFLLSALFLFGMDVFVMAWIVTTVRVVKLLMYFGLVKLSLLKTQV